MKIHILSDLHNEFSRESSKNARPVYTPSIEDADVVILAGDIDTQNRGVEWAKKTFHCPVIYVPGNHEYYGGHLERTKQKIRETAEGHVHVLDMDELVLDGVRFLGATGWTDFSSSGNHPLAMLDAQEKMSDYKKIRTGHNFRIARPIDTMAISHQTATWLRQKLKEPFDGQTVVITHHAPSLASIGAFRGRVSHLDAAYANRWEDMMGEAVTLWVHGHSHSATDYEIAGTRVVSNPLGYPGEETGFNPELVIDLDCVSKQTPAM